MSLTYDVLKDDVRAGRPIDFGFVTYVPERTCRMVDNGCELCCSECDGRCEYDDEPNYCPNCGARVEVE